MIYVPELAELGVICSKEKKLGLPEDQLARNIAEEKLVPVLGISAERALQLSESERDELAVKRIAELMADAIKQLALLKHPTSIDGKFRGEQITLTAEKGTEPEKVAAWQVCYLGREYFWLVPSKRSFAVWDTSKRGLPDTHRLRELNYPTHEKWKHLRKLIRKLEALLAACEAQGRLQIIAASRPAS